MILIIVCRQALLSPSAGHDRIGSGKLQEQAIIQGRPPIAHHSKVYLKILLQLEGNILGSKPCLIFSGGQFETESTYARLKNLLIGKGDVITICWSSGVA